MADNSVRINFIKTFVNTAGVMMDGLQIEKGRDMWYWRSAREVAELYPALKLAAAELNRNCGFRVSVPDDSPQGAFPAAEAFYYLYREIAEQGERNEDFVRARVLFNPGNGDFAKDVNAVSDWVAKSGSEFDRYWLNRGMVLSEAFAGEMQDEIFSGMMDEFLETRLAERMMYMVIRRGALSMLPTWKACVRYWPMPRKIFPKRRDLSAKRKLPPRWRDVCKKNAAGMCGANRFEKR